MPQSGKARDTRARPSIAPAPRPLVLLTNPIDPAGIELLRPHCELRTAASTDFETLRREAAGADLVIVRAPLPPDLIDHAPRLQGCVRHGAGVDFIPVEAASAAGVVVASVPGAHAQTVAEYCIAQFLLHARGLSRIDRMVHDGHWAAARAQAEHIVELQGCTVGIVGVGAIGSRLAAVCRLAFGMRVLGHGRDASRLPEGVEAATLDRLFADSDYVALCCAQTPETRHLVDARRLALMKPGAFLVNVARGSVIDQAALVQALRQRRIGGAALDVFEPQPPPPGDPLLALDHVVLTPQIAGLSVQSMRRTSVVAAEEALRILRGEPPAHFVNPEAWPAAQQRRARLAAELGPAR